jgi:hypothetical protein
MGKKPVNDALKQFREDIALALKLIRKLVQHGNLNSNEDDRLGDISAALTAIATRIDEARLKSRNAAIVALAKQLGQSAADLGQIHQQALDLKKSLDIGKELLDGFESIAEAITPVAAAPKSGKTT